jgi:allophanate hydrolase
VADGSVPFALGTDTAGSGRVPAAFNAIVGFKPSLGGLSTRGVVPACRSLDCISLMTPGVADAGRALAVAAAPDPADPYSRAPVAREPGGGAAAAGTRIAVPSADALTFAGDLGAATAWEHALRRADALGWTLTEIDFTPFAEVAALLYGGPWVAERYAGVGAFISAHPKAVDPVVRDVIIAGRDVGAVQAFQAAHHLRDLALECAAVWDGADAVLLPTAPTLFTAAEIAEEPLARNTLLGTYTNFVNLLDLCAVAVPAGGCADGLPFGVSLIAPAGADDALLALASCWGGEQPAADDGQRRERGAGRGRRPPRRRAAQRSARHARRATARDRAQRPDLPPLRPPGHDPRQARPRRRRAGRRRRRRARDLGAPHRGVRPIRRRRARAAVDRNGHARRRPPREGLSLRVQRRRPRAGHHRLRRLARLSGGAADADPTR